MQLTGTEQRLTILNRSDVSHDGPDTVLVVELLELLLELDPVATVIFSESIKDCFYATGAVSPNVTAFLLLIDKITLCAALLVIL